MVRILISLFQIFACRGGDHGAVEVGRSRQVGLLTAQGGAAAGGRSRQFGLLTGQGGALEQCTRTVVVDCSSRQATGCWFTGIFRV